MSAAEFSGQDHDFAMGSVKGLRSWGIDEYGRLHGVTHREVWRPGENVAKCGRKIVKPCPNPPKPKAIESEVTKGEREVASWLPWKKKTETVYYHSVTADRLLNSLYVRSCGDSNCFNGEHHDPAAHSFDPSCECGFWAYSDIGYKAHGEVSGVIEGYGLVTMGTKGFRCQKARIIALAKEREGHAVSRGQWKLLQRLYPEVMFFDDFDEMADSYELIETEDPSQREGFWDRRVTETDFTSYQSLMRKYLAGGIYGV